MEITRKIFWNEAMRGGTIIGLAVIVLGVIKSLLASIAPALGVIMSIVNIGAFVYLVFRYGKRISSMADAATGFPFPRAVGFSVAMMLFVGFLNGVYTFIYNNFINPEGIRQAIEEVMALTQDILPADQFDMTYAMMNKWMFSAPYLIFVGILGYVIYGAIVGLITSSMTKRDPDIFAGRAADNGGNGPAAGDNGTQDSNDPENRE